MRKRAALVLGAAATACIVIAGGGWLVNGCLAGDLRGPGPTVPTCAGTWIQSIGWIVIVVGVTSLVAVARALTRVMASVGREEEGTQPEPDDS